jgi:hypothetical protein
MQLKFGDTLRSISRQPTNCLALEPFRATMNRGGLHLLENIFKAYKAVRDQDFVKYIEQKESDYEDGSAISHKSLMTMAETNSRTWSKRRSGAHLRNYKTRSWPYVLNYKRPRRSDRRRTNPRTEKDVNRVANPTGCNNNEDLGRLL